MKSLKNIPASVRQRLLNRARSDRRPFNELLQYYAMERFLYRLSQSVHADRFVLKGALMLRVWHSPGVRPTMDIDLLGTTSNEEADIVAQIQDILAVDVEADGLTFDPDSVRAERIAEDADYAGIRIRFLGALGSARIHLQIDIGFGDVVYPERFISTKQTQWAAFRKRLGQDHIPPSFGDIVTQVGGFVSPIIATLTPGKSRPTKWTAPGPWISPLFLFSNSPNTALRRGIPQAPAFDVRLPRYRFQPAKRSPKEFGDGRFVHLSFGHGAYRLFEYILAGFDFHTVEG